MNEGKLKKLQEIVLIEEAVQFNDRDRFKFNLHKKHPEVPLSVNYWNFRHIVRDAFIRSLIADLMLPLIMKEEVELLVDLPQSISPLVTTLSDRTGINVITLRSEVLKGEKKTHGDTNPIMGKYVPGQLALILDDVVSSRAETKLLAASVLRKAGLRVHKKIFVIGDRDEGGKEYLERKGYILISILHFMEMLKEYLEAGKITKSLYDESIRFAEISKKLALEEK